MNKQYHIEHFDEFADKWNRLPSFSFMRKSFAKGAWAMLKAHYNHDDVHRLVCDGEVIEEIGKQKINL